MFLRKYLFVLVLLTCFWIPEVQAQAGSGNSAIQQEQESETMRIGRVRFTGNSAVRSNTLHTPDSHQA